jgi:hypothetical protein
VTFQSGDVADAGGVTICVEALNVDQDKLTADADLTEAVIAGDPAVEAEAKSRIETALTDVAKHPTWQAAEMDAAPPRVDVGCPSLPLPLVTRPEIRWRNGIPLKHISAPLVTEPSYRLFVFVARWELIDYLLGGGDIRVATQERKCEGDVCFSVSEALYLTPEEIRSDTRVVIEALEQGFFLKPIQPVPPGGSQ